MARIKFNARRATKNLLRQYQRAVGSAKLEKDMGKFLVNRVRLQARRGKPLNDDGKFPELSEVTKKIRKHLAEYNSTAAAFRAGTSNLTFTGQLLEALTFQKKKLGIFELFVKKSRRTTLRGKNGLLDPPPDNATVDKELRKGVGRNKRKFVMFSKKGLESNPKILERVKQLFLRSLRKELRRG